MTTQPSEGSNMGNGTPLNVVIIGGSIAGLMSGILLKRQGHNVRILEQAVSSEREGVAAGVGLGGHVKRFFDENDRLKDISIGTPNDFMEVLDSEMNVIKKFPVYLNMTTWDATYYRLRANFDSFKSDYCLEPPPLDPNEGQGRFDTGSRVLRVEGVAGDLTVLFEDVNTQEQHKITADFVIAADGANSTIRRQLHPDLRREEPGYVIWRGTVPTKELPKDVLDKIADRTILYPMRYSYAIIYTIPGVNGALNDGDREINFAWYFWPTKSASIQDILTDNTGHTHRTTLPKGKMRPQIWSTQIAHARRMFNPQILSIIEKIRDPFVSVISSISSERAAFFNSRLFLVGDALAQKQPNTAQGTNHAAMTAISVVDVITGKKSAEEWEEQALESSDRERLRSIAFASQWLCTYWGWSVNELRYRCMVRWQDWTKWWYGSSYPVVRAKL